MEPLAFDIFPERRIKSLGFGPFFSLIHTRIVFCISGFLHVELCKLLHFICLSTAAALASLRTSHRLPPSPFFIPHSTRLPGRFAICSFCRLVPMQSSTTSVASSPKQHNLSISRNENKDFYHVFRQCQLCEGKGCAESVCLGVQKVVWQKSHAAADLCVQSAKIKGKQ